MNFNTNEFIDACRDGDIDTLSLMMKNKKKYNHEVGYIFWAFGYGSDAVIELIMDDGIEWSPLAWGDAFNGACKYGDINRIKYTIEMSGNGLVCNPQQMVLGLDMCYKNNNFEAFHYIIQHYDCKELLKGENEMNKAYLNWMISTTSKL